jgi:uncharacterized protein
MSGQQRLPVEVDPYRMAELGRQYSGQIEIGSMKRLLPLLESAKGQVDVELHFDIDETGTKYLQGYLRADLELMCQRCLESMEFPLNTEFRLALIKSDSEAERLSGTYEPLVVETTPLYIQDVLEDEILLSLPTIPMHEPGACSIQPLMKQTELAEQHDEETEKTNPFAVLEKLKKDH